MIEEKYSVSWRIRSLLFRLGLWNRVERFRLLVRLVRKLPHEPDFKIFQRLGKKQGLFLDIGANVGQSAISFRIFNKSFKVLSFEPNPFLSKELKRLKFYLGRNYDFRVLGVGEVSQDFNLYFPSVQGCPLTQEGTLFRESLMTDKLVRHRVRNATGQEVFEIVEAKLRSVALDEMDLEPAVVKLDVQGSELNALKGMFKTLMRCRPILMLENGDQMPKVMEFLLNCHYLRPYCFDPQLNQLKATSTPHLSLNLFFLPEEQILEFIAGGWISVES